jgi:hypothetical protein
LLSFQTDDLFAGNHLTLIWKALLLILFASLNHPLILLDRRKKDGREGKIDIDPAVYYPVKQKKA